MLVFHFSGFAQLDQNTIDFWVDRWNSTEENATEYNYFDLLAYYNQHKIDLNAANAIADNPFLTESQIHEIQMYKSRHQEFNSIYELQQIESIKPEFLFHLIPFVKISNTHSSESTTQKLKIQYKRSSPKSKAYIDSLYAGDPNFYNLQYSYSTANFSFAARFEKDEGERLFVGTEFPKIDFSSAYLYFRDIGLINKIIIGNFGFSAGEGLCISTNSFIGSSTGLEIVKRGSRGLEAFNSNRENNALNGLGIEAELGHFRMSFFYSSIMRDASINQSKEINTLNEGSGLHRTKTELLQVKRLRESIFGSELKWSKTNLEISCISVAAKLSAALNPLRLDNQFDFRASHYSKHSIAYEYFLKNSLIYGEYCIDNSSKQGQIHGLNSTFGRHLDLALLYRKYQAGFITYQSTPFARHSNFAGEEGLYTNIRFNLKKLVLSVYLDRYRMNWIRYSISSLSTAHQWGVDLTYTKRKLFKLRLRIVENLLSEIQDEGPKWELNYKNRRQYRIHLDYNISKSTELRSRVQINSLNNFNSYLMYTEILSKFGLLNGGQLSIRISKAIVPSSALAISSYERSAPGMYPYAILTADLFYYYVLLKFDLATKLRCWVKYKAMYYDRELEKFKQIHSIGSGGDEIFGLRKNTFAFQIQYTLSD